MNKEKIVQGFIKRLSDENWDGLFIGYYTALLVIVLENDEFWDKKENEKISTD